MPPEMIYFKDCLTRNIYVLIPENPDSGYLISAEYPEESSFRPISLDWLESSIRFKEIS